MVSTPMLWCETPITRLRVLAIMINLSNFMKKIRGDAIGRKMAWGAQYGNIWTISSYDVSFEHNKS